MRGGHREVISNFEFGMWDVRSEMCEEVIYLTSQISHLLIGSCFGFRNENQIHSTHKLYSLGALW